MRDTTNKITNRGIAQLVEQRSPKPRAEGSSPSAPARTTKPVFRKNIEIQAFLLPIEGSLKRNFEVAYDCFTVKIHTKSHKNHTES